MKPLEISRLSSRTLLHGTKWTLRESPNKREVRPCSAREEKEQRTSSTRGAQDLTLPLAIRKPADAQTHSGRPAGGRKPPETSSRLPSSFSHLDPGLLRLPVHHLLLAFELVLIALERVGSERARREREGRVRPAGEPLRRLWARRGVDVLSMRGG